jgi:transglutaminase-like putative cysteine protease
MTKGVEMRKVRNPLFLAIVAVLLAGAGALKAGTETVYYGMELEGTVCGYSEINLSDIEKDGREMILLEQNMVMMIQALGAEVNSEVKLVYHIDPATGRFVYHESEIKQGQVDLWSKIHIEGSTALCEYSLGGDKSVDLPPDVLLENTLIYAHLVRDFAQGGITEKTYEAFDPREGEVQNLTYTLTGTGEQEINGEKYDALAFDVKAEKTGLNYKTWIDRDTGYVLRTEIGERLSYMTDASVKKRITMADANNLILADVDVLIPDVHAITYMKVRAKMQPSGLRVTPEDLNVPGQKFTGTVVDNLIDGVFEIEHLHYDGAGAPPFPPDFSGDGELQEFLEPDGFIQSEDTVLVDKARELTRGAADSWEAAVRLSEWVGKNIGYAIPGGGSARKTYDIRAGECGAHSFLLAAFCRAVGIPARVVWGCMYVSNRGGAFGQHAWNEIYMGEAGWIPVDATVMETRFADSGHIRFGMYQSLTTAFNPIEMEVLDYRLDSGRASDSRGGPELEPYAGKYRGPRGIELKVSAAGGGLTVDIPGQTVLPFTAPTGEGIWHCKLTDRVYLTFEKDQDGDVKTMHLHERVTMPRQSDPEAIDDDVPEHLHPYLGTYLFAQLQAEFRVLHRDQGLAVHDPLENETIRLQPPDDNGRWVDEFDKNTITFEMDADGRVTAMNLDVPNSFSKTGNRP